MLYQTQSEASNKTGQTADEIRTVGLVPALSFLALLAQVEVISSRFLNQRIKRDDY